MLITTLQSLVKDILSHLKDTNNFNKMKYVSEVTEDAYLVTMDINSPYNNNQNSEGIAAIKRALDKRKNKTIVKKVIITFLEFILPFIRKKQFLKVSYIQNLSILFS